MRLLAMPTDDCCCCYADDDASFYYEIDGIDENDDADDDDDADDINVSFVKKKPSKVSFSRSPIKVRLHAHTRLIISQS